MITVSGGFHNAPEIVLIPKVVDGRLKLSAWQAAKVRRSMCGMASCGCGGTIDLTVEGATAEQLLDAVRQTGV